jgi:hypothetical protein
MALSQAGWVRIYKPHPAPHESSYALVLVSAIGGQDTAAHFHITEGAEGWQLPPNSPLAREQSPEHLYAHLCQLGDVTICLIVFGQTTGLHPQTFNSPSHTQYK